VTPRWSRKRAARSARTDSSTLVGTPTIGVVGDLPSNPRPGGAGPGARVGVHGPRAGMVKATFTALGSIPSQGAGVGRCGPPGAPRDPNSPRFSVVGASRARRRDPRHPGASGGESRSSSRCWAGTNIFLGVFNLVPLPPLDGGHIRGSCGFEADPAAGSRWFPRAARPRVSWRPERIAPVGHGLSSRSSATFPPLLAVRRRRGQPGQASSRWVASSSPPGVSGTGRGIIRAVAGAPGRRRLQRGRQPAVSPTRVTPAVLSCGPRPTRPAAWTLDTLRGSFAAGRAELRDGLGAGTTRARPAPGCSSSSAKAGHCLNDLLFPVGKTGSLRASVVGRRYPTTATLEPLATPARCAVPPTCRCRARRQSPRPRRRCSTSVAAERVELVRGWARYMAGALRRAVRGSWPARGDQHPPLVPAVVRRRPGRTTRAYERGGEADRGDPRPLRDRRAGRGGRSSSRTCSGVYHAAGAGGARPPPVRTSRRRCWRGAVRWHVEHRGDGEREPDGRLPLTALARPARWAQCTAVRNAAGDRGPRWVPEDWPSLHEDRETPGRPGNPVNQACERGRHRGAVLGPCRSCPTPAPPRHPGQPAWPCRR